MTDGIRNTSSSSSSSSVSSDVFDSDTDSVEEYINDVMSGKIVDEECYSRSPSPLPVFNPSMVHECFQKSHPLHPAKFLVPGFVPSSPLATRGVIEFTAPLTMTNEEAVAHIFRGIYTGEPVPGESGVVVSDAEPIPTSVPCSPFTAPSITGNPKPLVLASVPYSECPSLISEEEPQYRASRVTTELAIKLCIEYLREKRYDTAIALHKIDPVVSQKIGNAAASTHTTYVLDYFINAGCITQATVLKNLRDVQVVSYIVECLGMPKIPVLRKAAPKMSYEVVKYFVSKGVIIGSGAAGVAIENSDIELFEKVTDGRSLKRSTKLYRSAIIGGNLKVVKYLHERQVKWDEDVLNFAILKQRKEIVIYMLTNGCGWNDLSTAYAAYTGNVAMLLFLVHHGCAYSVLTANAVRAATIIPGTEMHNYITYNLGIKEDMHSPTAKGKYLECGTSKVALFKTK